MPERGSRHLAAIMFTDMVGYTALLGDDEEAATQVRERHRTTLEKAIGGHATSAFARSWRAAELKDRLGMPHRAA